MMAWWDPWVLAEAQERTLRLGPLAVRVARKPGIVRLAHRSAPLSDAASLSAALPVAELADGGPEWITERFAHQEVELRGRFLPLTAPLPLVARPEVPLTIGPSEEIKVYLDAPLWLGVETDRILQEIPIQPHKPTWFGTPTEGRACYAVRSPIRVELANVPVCPHRAVAPIRIHNPAPEPLRIERLRVPVPALSLYAAADGRLWLQEVTMERREGSDNASVRPGAPGSGDLLCGPRETFSAVSAALHVFNAMFR